jgi:hypothetical protein
MASPLRTGIRHAIGGIRSPDEIGEEPMRESPRVWRMLPCVLAALMVVPAGAGRDKPTSSWTPAGAEVTEPGTGLIWSRCVEGMSWNGKTCAGQPLMLELAQAQAAASRRRLPDQAWRLPRVQELRRLAQHAAHAPAQYAMAFPAAAPGWHWSSSTLVDTARVNPYNYSNLQRGITERNVNRLAFLHGWAVNADNAEASDEFVKKTKLAVRLVRSPQPE